jgi:ribosome-associated protein
MAKDSKIKSALTLVDVIVKGIQEIKGKEICIVDLTKVDNAYSNYFIICSGTSDTHVQAISDSIEQMTRTLQNEKPSHIEGYREANWILMDYFDTMVHVFKSDEREHYNLEELWADAELTYITDNEDIING